MTTYKISFVLGADSATREVSFVPRVGDKVTFRQYGSTLSVYKAMVVSVEIDYDYDEKEIFTVYLKS